MGGKDKTLLEGTFRSPTGAINTLRDLHHTLDTEQLLELLGVIEAAIAGMDLDNPAVHTSLVKITEARWWLQCITEESEYNE